MDVLVQYLDCRLFVYCTVKLWDVRMLGAPLSTLILSLSNTGSQLYSGGYPIT
jgi:hypothetical protein